MRKEEIMRAIRKDFQNDEFGEFIGFMEVEADVECKDVNDYYFEKGQTVVFYKDLNTGKMCFIDIEIQYQMIQDIEIQYQMIQNDSNLRRG